MHIANQRCYEKGSTKSSDTPMLSSRQPQAMANRRVRMPVDSVERRLILEAYEAHGDHCGLVVEYVARHLDAQGPLQRNGSQLMRCVREVIYRGIDRYELLVKECSSRIRCLKFLNANKPFYSFFKK